MEQRVWIKAFWGFDPMQSAALGFTNEGDRKQFLDKYRPDDLVLIYGTSQPPTLPHQRGQCLGFLRLEPRPVPENDYTSDEELKNRAKAGNLGRWTYGLPMAEAWKVVRKVGIMNFAGRVFDEGSPLSIAARGILLPQDIADQVLKFKVTRASIRNLPPVDPGPDTPMVQVLSPSKAVPTAFGITTVERLDGPHRCYLMKLTGDTKILLNRPAIDVQNMSILKVGVSQDPDRRVQDLNSSLPLACTIKWKVELTSKPYRNREAGEAAEDRLKEVLRTRFESLGNEFFLANLDKASSEFHSTTADQEHIIVGQLRR